MKNKPTDPFLAQVMAAIHRKTETPEDGFRTIDQWAKHWAVSRTMATRYVHKAIELGMMEKQFYLVACRKDARPYPTAHYREKARPKKA